MPKTNWMIKFDQALKDMEKPLKIQAWYRSDNEIEVKLERLKQHFSTEDYRLSNSSVVRALIVSFYETVFKKEPK